MGRRLLLTVARALGLFRLARLLTARGVRILCYHGAWLETDGFAGDSMFIRPSTFERRLDALDALGYKVVSLADAVAGLQGRSPLPAASVVITIDDGWLSTLQAMVPALESRGLPATLYCDTGQLIDGKPIANMMALHFWGRIADAQKSPAAQAAFRRAMDFSTPMDQRMRGAQDLADVLGIDLARYVQNRRFHYMTAEQLREAAARGLDIQLHTHSHSLHDFSPDAIASEIDANRRALAHLLGKPPARFEHFCYPSGKFDEASGEVLGSIGVASATTLVTGLAFPGANIHLLPRVTDGEQLTDLMFEAELSGFSHLVRSARQRVERLGRALRSTPAHGAARRPTSPQRARTH